MNESVGKMSSDAEPVSDVRLDDSPPARTARRPPNRGRNGGRVKQTSLRLNLDEYARFQARADEAGLSGASFLRACALGEAGPRARRSVPVDAQLLAAATAALNKVGSNLNQIARILNAGHSIYEAFNIETLAEVRVAVAEIREAVGRRERP